MTLQIVYWLITGPSVTFPTMLYRLLNGLQQVHKDESRSKENSREESVPVVQDLHIFGVKGAIVRYRVLCLQTRQTKAARSIFPSENAVRSPWAINLRFVRHVEDRAYPPRSRLRQYSCPRTTSQSMGAPFIATKMGLEESLPSYCFSSSVVNGSSFAGTRLSRGACMMLLSGFLESASAGVGCSEAERNLDRTEGYWR
jgi:hypothetical protein